MRVRVKLCQTSKYVVIERYYTNFKPSLTFRLGFFIGMGYGDGRICKILAGEFESHASHKMFRSSSGRTSPFQGEGHGFESRTEYKKMKKDLVD